MPTTPKTQNYITDATNGDANIVDYNDDDDAPNATDKDASSTDSKPYPY